MQQGQIPMNDRTEHPKQLDAEPAPVHGVDARAPLNISRRRFARAGMVAGPVVLGSLASKPVLAITKAQYHCTISGKLSGNFSSHPDTVDCTALGNGPDTWLATAGWPSGFVKGDLPNSACNFTGKVKGTVFSAYAMGGNALADVFRYGKDSSSCVIYDMNESGFALSANGATMYQLLSTKNSATDTTLKALGRATVASLLNAAQYGDNYPLTQAQIIKMFNDVYRPGTKFFINASTSWDASQVKAYFESLYH